MANDPTNKADGQGNDDGVIQIRPDDVHPALANAPHPDQNRTYTVTVNGRQEQWTLDKVIAEAQTAAAGREKFQEAAEIRKEAAKALAMQEDMELVFKEGDIDAFRRIGAAMGLEGDEVEQIARNTFRDDDVDEDDEDAIEAYDRQVRGQKRTSGDEKVGYDRFTPDVQRLLREGEEARMGKIIDFALDNDEVIAYNMAALSPEGQKAIREYVNDKVHGRLPEHHGDFGDGTRILAEVLPEIREHLQALGIPQRRTPTGLGASPGGGGTEVYPRQKPDHVSSLEGDSWEQNILETLSYHKGNSERASR